MSQKEFFAWKCLELARGLDGLVRPYEGMLPVALPVVGFIVLFLALKVSVLWPVVVAPLALLVLFRLFVRVFIERKGFLHG